MGSLLKSPASGKVLRSVLALAAQITSPKKILEIGTFEGDGTWTLANCSPEAQIFTIEKEAGRAETALAKLSRSGFSDRVVQIVCDAEAFLASFLETDFDLILIDANKSRYPFYLQWARTRLRLGGILVVDNTLIHKVLPKYLDGKSKLYTRMEEFRTRILEDCSFSCVKIPNGMDEIILAVKIS